MSEWTDASNTEIVETLRDSVDSELADEVERRLEFYDRWMELPHHVTQRTSLPRGTTRLEGMKR